MAKMEYFGIAGHRSIYPDVLPATLQPIWAYAEVAAPTCYRLFQLLMVPTIHFMDRPLLLSFNHTADTGIDTCI